MTASGEVVEAHLGVGEVGVDHDDAPEELSRPRHVAGPFVQRRQRVPQTQVVLLGVADPHRPFLEECEGSPQVAVVGHGGCPDDSSLGQHVGVGTASEAGVKALQSYRTEAQVHHALDELKQYWHSRLGRFTVETPDADFNSMINVWNAYNCLITYAWSRAASLVYSGERDGLGYRDTVQDMLGVLPAIAEEARGRLELMLTGQNSTGGAMPVVKPFAATFQTCGAPVSTRSS